MGKQAKLAATPAAATTVPSITLQGTQATTKPATLQLVAGAKVNLRGARALWYATLVQYNGQPAAAFLAAATTTPPSLPKNGKAEPAQGWLRWFIANGYVVLQ